MINRAMRIKAPLKSDSAGTEVIFSCTSAVFFRLILSVSTAGDLPSSPYPFSGWKGTGSKGGLFDLQEARLLEDLSIDFFLLVAEFHELLRRHVDGASDLDSTNF